MKKLWSNKWVSSKQPRKQRKYRYNAPMHIRHKFVSVHLSPALRKQFKKRSVPIRKGDEIKVIDGSLKGKTGTIERVNLKKCKVYVDNLKLKKVDGSEIMRVMEPSNLMITKINLDDKMRQKALSKKSPSKKPKKETVKIEKIVVKTEGKKDVKKVKKDKKVKK